jgi:hypothetical protein
MRREGVKVQEPLTLHQLSRALDQGGELELNGYRLRREVTDAGTYLVLAGAECYPCESLPVALVTLATLAGTIEKTTKQD